MKKKIFKFIYFLLGMILFEMFGVKLLVIAAAIFLLVLALIFFGPEPGSNDPVLDMTRINTMPFDDLMRILIPPCDYYHREGFTNTRILDELTAERRVLVEDALIRLLEKRRLDELVVDSLVHLKSEESLPVLRKLLLKKSDAYDKLSLAAAIYGIAKDPQMAAIALTASSRIKKGMLVFAFFKLAQFDLPETNAIIELYSNDPDPQIAHNARRALKIGKLTLEKQAHTNVVSGTIDRIDSPKTRRSF